MEAELQKVARRYVAFLIVFSAVVVAMWLYGGNVFALLVQKSRAYVPPQGLTWLSLAASLAAATAFCIMPFSLFRVVRQRSDVPFGWIVLCIGGFLFLCGVTAFFGLINIWFHGPLVVWTLVLTRVGCALLAVGTLLILQALVPQILKIPTAAQWLAVNKELLQAEARGQEKERLLATVSHELRTPLAPLLAGLTELEHRITPLDDRELNDCVQMLRKNVLREARLVNDLIDKLEVPGPEPVPLPDFDVIAESKPRRLLLVEDHVDTLRAFARALRREGFEVQEAQTVGEAIAAARAGDFLVSDIALPDGDGCELMRRCAQLGIPGIAISGFGTARDREEYQRAGFAESFVKPVDIRQVLGAINRVMAIGSRLGGPMTTADS